MASRRSWRDFQAACRFYGSAIGRLVVWSTEESHPLNRESSPRDCIFPSAFFLVCIFPLLLCSSSFVIEGRFLGLLLAALLSQGRLYRSLHSSCKLVPGMFCISISSS